MLMDLLVEAAQSRGKKVAVSDERVTLTYKQLLSFAQAIQRIVSEKTAATNVGVMLPAGSAFAGMLFGTLWAKRTAIPLNFLLPPAELSKIVADAELDTIFTIRYFADLVKELPVRVVFLEDLPLKKAIALNVFRRKPPSPAVDPDDTAIVLYTSGTSGEPKGVELSYKNLHSNTVDCITTAKLAPDHRFLNCLPPFHAFGLTANVLIPIALGASVYCIPRFSAVAVAEAIRKHRISVFLAIPSMFGGLLRLKSAEPDLLKEAFLLLSGGEPLPESIADGFRQRFGVELHQGYGLTETSPVCTLDLPGTSRFGTIGRAVNNVSIRIVDDSGSTLPPDSDGEIWIKGPNVMKGYRGRPRETASVITPDGWLKTGDCGQIDGDGYVKITGRFKDMMIIGGENVFPREIETVIETHDAVDEVAVIGAPDDSRGEVPVAFVTTLDGKSVTELELREHVRKQLAGYKVPKRIEIRESLPRGVTGKILKRKLAELL